VGLVNTFSSISILLNLLVTVFEIVSHCAAIEWIKPLFLEGGRFLNQENKQVALLGQVYSGEQLDYLPAMMGGTEIVVINDLDWQVCELT